MKTITRFTVARSILFLITTCCLGAGIAQSSPLNGDFETGDLTDWGFATIDGVVADNGPSAPGSFAASTTIALPQSFEQALAKSTAIPVGAELDFSFDYKTLPGATGVFHVQLRYWDGVGANGFSDGGGGFFRGEHTVTLSPTNGQWQTTALTDLPFQDTTGGLAPPDYVDIRFIANAFGPFEGTALVDNFNIGVPIPEPATLSLLCLGGLAMFFRRRKA